MAVITIGAPATSRSTSWTDNVTYVNKGATANGTGNITSVEIWIAQDSAALTVATFYTVSGDNLSTRDSESVGAVTGGSKQTFSVDLDVVEGDYIGFYGVRTPRMDTSGGAGLWYGSGNRIPCTNLTFTFYAGYVFSLYGTGTAVAVGNALFFGSNF